MIGIDSNILVRYLAQDEPAQAARASRSLDHDLTNENPGYVNRIVMVETGWVLRRTYKFGPDRLASAIEQLLRSPALVVEDSVLMWRAASRVRDLGADFADALIAEVNARDRCDKTLTFDRGALRLPEFAPL